jgi:glycosyltransferase 2 family protein
VTEAVQRSPVPSPRRTWLLRVARLTVTGLAFAWVFSRVDRAALWGAIQRTSPAAFFAAVILASLNLVPGTLRWGLLMRAYGATRVPPFSRLLRMYWIAFFYNLWLPGGVGGDVVRGVASREAFGAEGATSALAVVFVDRVMGLVGLLLVVAVASLIHPIPGVQGVELASVLGLAAGLGAIVFVAGAKASANKLPSVLGRIASRLPSLVRPGLFGSTVGLAVLTQGLVACTGHILVAALHPEVPLLTSCVMIPLAMATAYIPITVGGAGAREAMFQTLYGLVGVPFEDATAASLLSMAAYYLSSSVGGVLVALDGRREPADAAA